MTVEIYWGSGSPFAWTALLVLEAKGIPYESRLMSFAEGDLKTPEFLALNPRGKVPVLRDGDFALPESLAIIAYLDAKHPEPPLLGRTPEETGRVWKAIADDGCYRQPAARRIAMPVFRGIVADNADDMRAAAQELHGEIKALNALLEMQAWLAGNQMSAADLVSYPTWQLTQRAAAREEARMLDLGFDGWQNTYPAIAAWCDRVETLPGYDRTYPPHWREG